MTKHKHYYAIRAYADGWKIELNSFVGWGPTSSPVFYEDREYRVIPDKDGWLPWYGGECPVDGTAFVDVRYKHCLVNEADYAHIIRWKHLDIAGDVIAYRVIKEAEADPYAKLKAAAENPTKQIRYTFPNGVSDGWHDCGFDWSFDKPPENYEIRNKPKKMKLLAYIDEVSGELLWRLEGHKVSSYWKRAPSEDKEIEVEE